jgi:glycosyltransferase involved in cell wall biosynthesis
MPRFSIIITCYNQGDVIAEAVDSALAQDFPDKEIIVVDDCSTDGSVRVLEKYGNAITLAALGTNGGAERARNGGAAIAGGDFLVFLDGDDRLLPWALDVYGRVADLANPAVILATMHYFNGMLSGDAVAEGRREIKVVVHADYFAKDRSFRASASSMVIERRAFDRVGGWTEGTFPADDQDLLYKLGCTGPAAQIVSPKTSAYRSHERNATRSARPLLEAVHLLLQRERQGFYPGDRNRRFERHAVMGGFVFFLVKRAWQSRLLGEGLKLLTVGWPLVGAAVLRRGGAVLRGRHPETTLPQS